MSVIIKNIKIKEGEKHGRLRSKEGKTKKN